MVGVYDSDGPINVAATASETIYQGYVYKISSDAITVITAKGDTAVCVADESTVDAEQTARVARSGEQVGVWPLGCGRIVKVASVASQTWAIGAPVYLHDSVDGMVTTSAATSRPIGHYMGAGETTSASNGDLIDTLLDVQIGAATV